MISDSRQASSTTHAPDHPEDPLANPAELDEAREANPAELDEAQKT